MTNNLPPAAEGFRKLMEVITGQPITVSKVTSVTIDSSGQYVPKTQGKPSN